MSTTGLDTFPSLSKTCLLRCNLLINQALSITVFSGIEIDVENGYVLVISNAANPYDFLARASQIARPVRHKKLSSELIVLMGRRPTEKTHILNRICEIQERPKYIRKFTLVQRSEEDHKRHFDGAVEREQSSLHHRTIQIASVTGPQRNFEPLKVRLI